MSIEADAIQLKLTFKHTESTDAIRNYAEDKILNCLKKFIHRSTDAHVIFSVEKNRQIAEISFHADGHDFFSKEESTDLYASIDALVETLTKQLRRHKDKHRSHH